MSMLSQIVTLIDAEMKQRDHQDMLLSLALISGQLRKTSGIWRLIILDLLQQKNCSIQYIADAIQVSPRTINRSLQDETKNPLMATGIRLLIFYMKVCFSLQE